LTIYLKLALRIREILQSKGQGVRQRARFDELTVHVGFSLSDG
jgi:hypothetical protein